MKTQFMKKVLLFCLISASIAAIMLTSRKKTANTESIILEEIEAITDCESVNGYPNDGYCRSNDYNEYFCGSSHWLWSDNCRQHP